MTGRSEKDEKMKNFKKEVAKLDNHEMEAFAHWLIKNSFDSTQGLTALAQFKDERALSNAVLDVLAAGTGTKLYITK